MTGSCVGCTSNVSPATNSTPVEEAQKSIGRKVETMLTLSAAIMEKLSGPAIEKDNNQPCRMGLLGFFDRTDNAILTVVERLQKILETL